MTLTVYFALYKCTYRLIDWLIHVHTHIYARTDEWSSHAAGYRGGRSHQKLDTQSTAGTRTTLTHLPKLIEFMRTPRPTVAEVGWLPTRGQWNRHSHIHTVYNTYTDIYTPWYKKSQHTKLLSLFFAKYWPIFWNSSTGTHSSKYAIKMWSQSSMIT